MKVALCFSGCFRRGGVERVVLATANQLCERGHEVHVFAREIERDQLNKDVVAHEVQAPATPPAWALARFGPACAKAVRLCGVKFEATGGFGVACPPCDLAWIQSVHSRWLKVSQGTGGGSRLTRARRRLNPFHTAATWSERRRFGKAGHCRLAALTDDVASDLVHYYEFDPKRIDILPNGFDPKEFSPKQAMTLRDDVRQRWGLAQGDKVLTFVANESIRKGLPNLLRVLSDLQDARVKVLAAGRLPEAEIKALARSLGVFDQVIQTGPINDVTKAYAAGDIFVLPTQYEAWGLVIVEALACGLPVITARSAGAAVAVEHGKTGWLLDDPGSISELKQAVLRALATLPLDAAVREQRFASIQGYRWEKIIERYESLLISASDYRRQRQGATAPT